MASLDLNLEITIDDLLKLDVKRVLNNILKSANTIYCALQEDRLDDKAFNILGSFGPCIATAERNLKVAESFIKKEPKQ